MRDQDYWQIKFKMCQYSKRLLNQLLILNEHIKDKVDIIEIKKAIYYARKYHADQKRQSGEPYYSHPIEVAYMVATYTAQTRPRFFRTDMIVTSLLHDCLEDTNITEETINIIFGSKVANQVQDLTRIKPEKKISVVEMINSLFIQGKSDILIIKIFDRLHNMRTLYAKSSEKIDKTVNETLCYFVPLAMHLNMNDIANELINISLKYLLGRNCKL
ncbi:MULTISPECIES: HD domain-containing protein [unclassified Candidatus Tisiphia]|jgi:(p)ppGpp synthase/HD superfamily hydrolase|uniref:HD domain-containing protein n=1 Tax=unclassified Candidatus Tisiphia TaxID=2996318 RepID=UPI001E7289A4|nr:MAG: HD domain-containing protein [Rickettsia endosymbiont of Cimex lectularius]